MLVNSISDFRKAVRNGPYAWPGGYPLYWTMSDGEACAFKVAKAERRAMLEAEYEYSMADEQVDESIRANEYQFDEDGRIT